MWASFLIRYFMSAPLNGVSLCALLNIKLHFKGVFPYWKEFLRAVFLKVGLSPSINLCVICFIESPLNMMINAF